MPLNNNNFDNNSRVGFNKILKLEGLDCFVKNLEKHFFSQVTVRNCSTSINSVHLVVELDCNFGLLETMHHFEKDTWGNFKSQQNSFAGALKKLRESNDLSIEIEEFSLFLKDTSIIVSKLYDQSISLQLEHIFIQLKEHAIYFTKGYSEIPFEIYLPVYEDSVIENEHSLMMNTNPRNNNKKDYFSFWGLYYYSEDDALVYDSKSQSIIKGNLQMLNR